MTPNGFVLRPNVIAPMSLRTASNFGQMGFPKVPGQETIVPIPDQVTVDVEMLTASLNLYTRQARLDRRRAAHDLNGSRNPERFQRGAVTKREFLNLSES
jgi:hypothetical protein